MSSINRCSLLCNVKNMKQECIDNGCKYYKRDDNELTSKDFNDYQYDLINKPAHYTKGRQYEPIKVINDWELNFNLGNTVKYISRAGRKGDKLEDLKKAAFYLNYEIERLSK